MNSSHRADLFHPHGASGLYLDSCPSLQNVKSHKAASGVPAAPGSSGIPGGGGRREECLTQGSGEEGLGWSLRTASHEKCLTQGSGEEGLGWSLRTASHIGSTSETLLNLLESQGLRL